MNASLETSSPYDMVNLMILFLKSRPHSVLRLADFWKLMKVEYPEHPTVLYWQNRNKEKHGIPVEVSTALEDDDRVVRLSVGRREVYYKLA
jgi:hypothetical protein